MEKKDSDTIICIGKELDESMHLFDKINISSDQPCLEWPECCISRVPKKLRKISEEAYTPKLISIGPFHHGGNEFKDMEKQKVRCFTDFLKRTGKSMKDLLEIIKVDEEKISHCYSEEKISHCYSEDCILGSDDHFVKMILLDTIFIIELFLKCHYPLQPYICNYADLLDNLIDSEKDVDLLVEKKIIVNNVGSNQRVAELINRLCLEIVVHNESCYSDIGEDLNAYSENHWNRIMAGMKSKFFCDFWRGAATTFAIFFTLDQLWGLVRPFVINK
ncbi:uncharacterized protein LOC133879181 [Alnus glutinosa]|uniref:uncharacterized protein LOC133879181 n=1 Tax=Alnus glutinosa TaxID=3517 RepID=UPI002D776912|nr:uncharacterized protein LOC133879181 [Alnus glutinosa]